MDAAHRRKFLKAAGVTAAGLAAAATWRAWNQGVFSTGNGPAYSAWKTWQADAPSVGVRMVRAAILAASPHNTQPWRFRLTPTAIDLFADRARNIGTIDPFLREMHVGLGCALENLLLAASAEGFTHELTLLPDPSDVSHVARVQLKPGAASASALYRAIPLRHTNRGAYESRPLPASMLDALHGLGSDLPEVTLKWITTPEARRELGALIVQATEAIISDREQSRDSAAWFRGSWPEIQAYRDGLTVDAQALPAWIRIAAKMLPAASQEQADSVWLKATREVHVATAPAFGLILARDAGDNASRLQGGRLWQRMQLYAQTAGVAMQPLNQLSERADRERSLNIAPHFANALEQIVGDSEWHALMPFRLGYPTVTPLASPRRHAEEVILT